MRRWAVLVLLLLPSVAWATQETLYVRPPEACTYNGDGTAYACAASNGAAGAFRTSDNILVSATDETAGKVDPGDLLYVCGSFIKTTNGNFFYGPTDATGTGSGTTSNRVTISFACPGDPGSISALVGVSSYAFATYAHDLNIVLSTAVLQGGTLDVLILGDSTADETTTMNITVTGGTVTHSSAANTECVRAIGRNITIDGTTIYDCQRDGIFAKGKNTTVKNTIISRVNMEGNTNVGDCIQHTAQGDGYLVQNNYCDHTNVDSKYCFVNNGVSDSGLAMFIGNTCIKNSTDAIGAGHAGARSEGSAIFRSNTFTGGTTGVHCLTAGGATCELTGNLFLDVTGPAMRIADGTVNACNNTVITATTGVQVDGTATTQLICNNIFANVTTGIAKTSSANPIDKYNLFYNVSGNNVTVSGSNVAAGTGSLLATNPLFRSSTYADAEGYNLHGAALRSTSPARRTGFQTVYCADVRERVCPSNSLNIGAYQTGSGDAAATRAVRQ